MTKLSIETESPETAVLLMEILMEVDRAEQKHPIWPECHIKQIAIVMEEAGELVSAGNQIDEGKGTFLDVRTEAIQTAATSIRFLKRLAETEKAYNQSGIIEYFSESEVNND
jgi:hypothetical protein